MTTETDQLASLKDAWAQARRRYWMLTHQERIAVNILAALVCIGLIFLLIIQPAINSRSQAALELNAKRTTLQWVKDNESRAAQASRSSVKTGSLSGQGLMALVTNTSSQMSVSLKRYEPEGDNKLRVYLEDQSFNKVMRWLDTLDKQHGTSIVNISLDASREPGLVTAKIVLRS
ncbi:general secretion pathway protein M, component PulM [gamma proteobacterium HdN1]|nr:general secretion pathway protein M, component PulM [gamma proteobacterium HdN1]